MSTKVLFPFVYLVFGLPLVFGRPWVVLAVGGGCLILAALLNGSLFLRLGRVLVTSLATFVVLLGVIQTAACTSGAGLAYESLAACLLDRMPPIVMTATALAAITILAACNEWRASLVATVNGLFLPRRLRVIAVISAAMVGEFRKAFLRVHHAATARGDAAPSVRIGNIKALPRILACTWGAVLTAATERIQEQWSSNAFWNLYVPAKAAGSAARRDGRRDAAVILAAFLAIGAAAVMAAGKA